MNYKNITVADVKNKYNFQNLSEKEADKLLILLRKICVTILDGIIEDKYEK